MKDQVVNGHDCQLFLGHYGNSEYDVSGLTPKGGIVGMSDNNHLTIIH